MVFDVLTIFPEFFAGPFDHGIIRKAREAGLMEVRIHNLRDYTSDRHQVVDDRPFGGGEGMVLKPEPIFQAVETLWGVPSEPRTPSEPRLKQAAGFAACEKERVPAREAAAPGEQSEQSGTRSFSRGAQNAPRFSRGSVGHLAPERVILLSARGRLLTQQHAAKLARCERLMLICGRYEGVDERVAEGLADEEICIGDYILTGGELPAAVLVDCVTRLLPGALGHQLSSVRESFCPEDGVLDCPHYTRPADFRGMPVPDVLISGHHEQVRRWRRKKALEKTLENRPELIERAVLSKEDRELLLELHQERDRTP